jgi:N-acetylneuraminate lyase
MNRLNLNGLVAAPHTPFDRDGALRLDIIEKQASLLVESGVRAAFVCGTTGEGLSLTGAERREVVRRWVDVTRAVDLPVIVHVGHPSVAESAELAAHAQATGAQAISAFAPCFFKPRGVPELVDSCARIAAAAPALPFYYYHLPSMTGVLVSMVDFLEQARSRIPTFAGIKYTHNDLMEFRRCTQLGEGSLDILFGRDEILIDGLLAGAKGAVGSTYNYAAPVYRRLIDAFRAGDIASARRLQDDAVRLVEVIVRFGEIPAAKAILAMMGVDCGPARPPLTQLDDAAKRSIYAALKDLPIFARPLAQ